MDGWFRSVCCCAEPSDNLQSRNGNGEWKELSKFSEPPNTLLPSSYPPKGVAGEMQGSAPWPQQQSPLENSHRGNGHRPDSANDADQDTLSAGRTQWRTAVGAEQEGSERKNVRNSDQDESAAAAGKLPQPILQKEKSDKERIDYLKTGDHFKVSVVRSEEQRSLGIDINHADGESLVIEMVHEGLIDDWNAKRKEMDEIEIVLVGDRIISVNGHRGVAEDLIKVIRQNHEIEFVVERG